MEKYLSFCAYVSDNVDEFEGSNTHSFENNILYDVGIVAIHADEDRLH